MPPPSKFEFLYSIYYFYYYLQLLSSGSKLSSQKVVEPDWKTYLNGTAELIVRQQSADSLLKVRNRLYELLSRCIPTNVIFEELLDALLPHCNSTFRREVIDAAAHFEHTAIVGSKDIYHLDAFVATFMSIYKENAAK